MKDRPPLDTERLCRTGLSSRVVLGKSEKRLGDRALIELVCHSPTICPVHPAIKADTGRLPWIGCGHAGRSQASAVA
jgi:hypothetical protein